MSWADLDPAVNQYMSLSTFPKIQLFTSISRRVSKFENPAKGRPQTSSLRSAVICQNVNKMAARKRTLTVVDVVRIVSTKQSSSVASGSPSNSFSTVLNKTLDELID